MVKKRKRQKRLVLLIFGLLIVFVILLGLFLIVKFVLKNDFYKVESRTNKIIEISKKDNSDYHTIAWLRVQGTNIDFPIVAPNESNSELPTELESYGWTLNEDDRYYNKMNVYGHNIFNLGPNPKINAATFKRFEDLMAFVYEDFAKDNKYIQLTIDGKDYLYKIFSVGFMYQADTIVFPKGDYDKDELDYQINLFKKISIYDYDVDVNSNDDLISVVTCTRFFGNSDKEFIVSGRLVRENESIKNYSLKKNSNYKEVENKLKGDGDDEFESA